MKRKIFAAACAVLALGLLLTACGKKYLIVENDRGMEYAAVTDEEGNTVVNDDGDIVVYVTDADGEIVTDSNGDPQTNNIEFPKVIASGSTVETADFKLTMPDGWTADAAGMFRWEGDTTTYVQVVALRELEAGETLESCMETESATAQQIVEKFREEYPDTTLESSDCTVGAAADAGKRLDFRVPNADGSMLFYSENIYFVHGETLYKAEYICQKGATVPDFDLGAALGSLTFKA